MNDATDTTTEITVDGMTCDHCVAAVRSELEQLDGVRAVEVDLDSGAVRIHSAATLTDHDVDAAVDEAGYEVRR